ncbi:uncharacterized protein V6R79_012672 [Siganus canaliculatus]
MEASTPKRIVLLGKPGVGKSSLANTIFGEELFTVNHISYAEMSQSPAKTKLIMGRSISLIDTPGLFDMERSEEELKPEIMRCITECSPGPHAFIIVLKVERFTQQEDAIINKILQCFSEEALKYAVIVFTHGDQLQEGMTIEEFFAKNVKLSELVQKCGGRCHVVDNKYWKKTQEGNYRCNQVQVAALFNTLDKMEEANRGSYYTNDMLEAVEAEIRSEEENFQLQDIRMALGGVKDLAQKSALRKLLIKLAGTTSGALVGALLGVMKMATSASSEGLSGIFGSKSDKKGIKSAARSGALSGILIGFNAAEEAEGVGEAMEKAADAVWNESADEK